jgi:hypothetical protein
MGLLEPRDFKSLLVVGLRGINEDDLRMIRQCSSADSLLFLLSPTLSQL